MIIYDARHIANEYSGLGRYSAALLCSILPNLCGEKLLVILPSCERSNSLYLYVVDCLQKNKNVHAEVVDIPLFGIKHHFLIGRLNFFKDCYLYIYPHFDVPISVRSKIIYVVHDTFVLDVPNYLVKHEKIKKLYFWLIHNWLAASKNTYGVCVSENTKKDVLSHLVFQRNQLTTIRPGLTRFSDEICSVDAPSEYLIYVGDRRPHKNLGKMIDVFNQVRQYNEFENLHFLVVGSNQEFGQGIGSLIENTKNVSSVSNVSEEELNYLYQNAKSLFFMTKYEGFGLPVIEAWSWQIGIITSDVGATKEIAPDGSLLLAPNMCSSKAAEAVVGYLNSDKRPKKFDKFDKNWDFVGEQFAKLISRIIRNP